MASVGSRRRMARINHLIREELSEMLQRGLNDPRVARAGLVSITDVETAPDLSAARVWVSVLGEPADRQATLRALTHAAGFFRSQLASRLTTRTVPQLDFRMDESMERGDRLLQMIRETSAEPPVPDVPTTEPPR